MTFIFIEMIGDGYIDMVATAQEKTGNLNVHFSSLGKDREIDKNISKNIFTQGIYL